MNKNTILSVRDLKTEFVMDEGTAKAVAGVSFDVDRGQVVGIVGESGCGKSVTIKSILGIVQKPGKVVAGEILFRSSPNGEMVDLRSFDDRGKEMRDIRGNEIALIPQEPMAALSPVHTIGDQLTEPLELHENLRGKPALHRAIDALAEVGIPDPEKRIRSYPHEFSGGMRQRVMIAMSLITKPELLICDEPTTALDVTVQKQVLDLIRDRQRDLGTAVIFITHDLAVVSEVCDVINVMYAGRIVETATRAELFNNPLHAYTRSLLRSIPAAQPKGQPLITIPGLPPNLTNPPQGCAFQPRNLLGDPKLCVTDHQPELAEIKPGHFAQNCPGCLA